MKLVGTEFGRLIVFFLPEEIRPERGLPIRRTIDLIKERYQFLQAPNLTEDIEKLDQEGYRFQQGVFTSHNGESVIKELSIFRDGISITALRTDIAEEFFDDFLSWAQQALSLKRFADAPKRLFLSQVYVEFEQAPDSAFKQYESLLTILRGYLCDQTELDLPVHIKRIDFGFDPEKVPGLRPANFILDRRVSTPFEKNRFISEAPLKTDQHLSLLEEIERLWN